MIPIKNQLNWKEFNGIDWLVSILLSLSITPLLIIKGATGLFGTILLLVALLFLLKNGTSLSHLRNKKDFYWVCLSLSAPFLALLFAQLIRSDINIKSYDGPIRLIFAIPLFLLIVSRTVNFVNILRWIIPASTIILFFYALIHEQIKGLNLFSGLRLTFQHIDPIIMGNYALLLAFFNLFLIRKELLAWRRTLLIIGFISGATISVLSQSRGGWIAAPILTIIWAILNRSLFSKKYLLISLALAGLLPIAAYFYIDLIAYRIDVGLQEIISWFNGTSKETSLGIRLSMWKLSTYLFSLNPLSGYGDKNFDPSFLANQTLLSIGSRGGVDTLYCCGPHNEFFANLLRSGIFGLASYFLIYFLPLVLFIKSIKYKPEDLAPKLGVCLIVSMLIMGIGNEMLSLKFTYVFYAIILSILLGQSLKK